MTSNVGARLLSDKKSLGFSANTDKKQEENKEYEDTKKEVMSELKKQFRPEFINRIDEIIVFHKLNENDITITTAESADLPLYPWDNLFSRMFSPHRLRQQASLLLSPHRFPLG